MDITLLATSLSSAITLAKSIATVASDATIKVKSIELLDTIINLQGGVLSLQSEYQSLLQEKYSLEKKLMKIDSWEQEKTKYELVKLAEGGHVFSLKRDYESSMPFHYICPNCYHENKKSILVAEYTSPKESKYVCPKCHNFFVTNTDINSGGAFTVEDF